MDDKKNENSNGFTLATAVLNGALFQGKRL
jgi:hypothetical protein